MNNSNTDTAPVSSPAAQKPLPSYYAIIPADVRYHPDLPANAKLLYGELTALCNKEGYCWSSNDYFAELYGVKILSIKRWIAALENAGFVTVLLDRTGTRRRIILGEVTAKKIRDGIKNDTGWYPKRYAPRIKKDTHNTTVNTKGNNKENTKEEAEELPPPPPSMGEPPPAAAARAQDFLSSPPLFQEPKGPEPKGPEPKGQAETELARLLWRARRRVFKRVGGHPPGAASLERMIQDCMKEIQAEDAAKGGTE